MFKKVLVGLAAILFLVSPAYSQVMLQDDGTNVGIVNTINFLGASAELVGTIGRVADTQELPFSLDDFILADGTDFIQPQRNGLTSPYLQVTNSLIALVWEDGVTTAAQVNFIVPADYTGGAMFKVVCDREAGDPNNAVYVDYQLYITSEGTAWDTSASDEAPLEVDNDGSPEVVEFTSTSELIAAGSSLTFGVWRDDTAGTSTSALEIYGVSFLYH